MPRAKELGFKKKWYGLRTGQLCDSAYGSLLAVTAQKLGAQQDTERDSAACLAASSPRHLTEGQESNQQNLIGEMETEWQQKTPGDLETLLQANSQPAGFGVGRCQEEGM